ncbi:MAG: GlsB/YeaQ/YmgE family stress response membrane protein [Rhodanobacter sp.]|nr:GlsB/YeaQ/YmgE family stress response membrane protein [Rhodanobacter sp.]
MKGGGFGIIGDIIVGVVGAVLGGFLFSALGISAGGGLIGALIVATIGAVILIFLLRLIKRK